MKKLITLALALLMVLSLAACGGGNDTSDPSGSGTTDPGTQQTDPGTQQTDPGTSQQGQNNTPTEKEEWPDNEWTTLVPKPTTGTISSHQYYEDMGLYYINIKDWTLEEAEAYMQEVAATGFVDEFTDGEPQMEDMTAIRKCYEAQMKNNNGYEASVLFYPETNKGEIILSKAD